jgi:hypothetical protein
VPENCLAACLAAYHINAFPTDMSWPPDSTPTLTSLSQLPTIPALYVIINVSLTTEGILGVLRPNDLRYDLVSLAYHIDQATQVGIHYTSRPRSRMAYYLQFPTNFCVFYASTDSP